jgi:hypothetical protein
MIQQQVGGLGGSDGPLLPPAKVTTVLAGGLLELSRRFLTHRNWNYLGLFGTLDFNRTVNHRDIFIGISKDQDLVFSTDIGFGSWIL